MSEKKSTVTEELKCDTLVPFISSPLEWLKFGGVEMKFSEKIDLTSEPGKLVLQLQESVVSTHNSITIFPSLIVSSV